MPNLPFAFGLSFFYRIIIPGAIAALLFLLLGGHAGFLYSLEGITLFVMATILVGLVIRTFSPFIYGFLYYGESWPWGIRLWKIRALQGELGRAEEALEARPPDFPSAESFKRQRMQDFVLNFPFTDGQRFAIAPTVMGNMVASLLAYLSKLYSLPELTATIGYTRDMTSMVVRLWYALEREVRSEVSETFAHLDALIISFPVLFLAFVSFLAKGLWHKFYLHTHDTSDSALISAAVLLFLLWGVYRAAERETLSVVVLLEGLFGRDKTRGQVDAAVEAQRRAMKAKALPKAEDTHSQRQG